VPYPPRILYDGAFYHVMARGNARQPIYLDDFDKELFLHEFDVTREDYGWMCHRYCVMTNHYHFIIETPKGNLSAGMQRLNSIYARKFNKRHGRSDHLFRARFRAVEIHGDRHFMETCRYVDLNPVRAKVCDRPEDWPWSSFRPTIGLAPVPRFLTVDRVLEYFGPDKRLAAQRYIEFVNEAGAPRSLDELELLLKLPPAPGSENLEAA
jgi:REP element-mobilizing transposase RayT